MAAALRKLRSRLAFWRWYLLVYVPMAGGAEGDPDPDPDKDKGKEKPDPKAEEDKPDPENKPDPDPDWKARSRKNESRAKKAERERAELQAKLEERENADKTETQKQVDAAREEGRKAAAEEAEKGRRADRLEVSVTRVATRGFKIGEGDDEETVQFADPDDALLHIERGLRNGDIDEADIFDEKGKVQDGALKSALGEILEEKKHLRAGAGSTGQPKADPDRRRGSNDGKTVEDLTPAEWDERIKAGK